MNLKEALNLIKPPTPVEGQAICPDCEGYHFVAQERGGDGGVWIEICSRCVLGIVTPCQHCGAIPLSPWSSCSCPGATKDRQEKDEASMRARWRKNPAEVWDGGEVWSERLEKAVEWDALEEAWWEHCGGWDIDGEQKLPSIDPEWALLYDLEPVHLTYKAETILEHWRDEYANDDWDPTEDLDGVAELEAFLTDWTEKYGQDVGWQPDLTKPLRPVEEEE